MKQDSFSPQMLNIFDELDEITDYVRRAGFDALNADERNRQRKRSRRVCTAFSSLRRYTRENPEGMPMSELAHVMHMTPSAATHMVDAMAKQGIVTRNSSPSDRRSVLVQLTEENQQNSEIVESGLMNAGARLRKALSASERESLRRILNKLLAVVREDA